MIKNIECHPVPHIDHMGEQIIKSVHRYATILGDHVSNTDIHVSSLITNEDIDNLIPVSDDCKCTCESQSILEGYITKAQLEAFGFLRTIPEDYVTEDEMRNYIASTLDGIKSDVTTIISESTDLSNYFDKLTINQMLLNYYDKQTINSIVDSLKNTIPSKVDVLYTGIGKTDSDAYQIGVITINGKPIELYGKDAKSTVVNQDGTKTDGYSYVSKLVLEGTMLRAINSDGKPSEPADLSLLIGSQQPTITPSVINPDKVEFESWYSITTDKTSNEIGNPDTKPSYWTKTSSGNSSKATWLALKTSTYKWNSTTKTYPTNPDKESWIVWMTRATVDSINWNGVDDEITNRISGIIESYTGLSAENVQLLLQTANLILDANGRLTVLEEQSQTFITKDEFTSLIQSVNSKFDNRNTVVDSQLTSIEQRIKNIDLSTSSLRTNITNNTNNIASITAEVSRINLTKDSITSTVGEWNAENILSNPDRFTAEGTLKDPIVWEPEGNGYIQRYANYAKKNNDEVATGVIQLLVDLTTYKEISVDIYVSIREVNENSPEGYEYKLGKKTITFKHTTNAEKQLGMVAFDNMLLGNVGDATAGKVSYVKLQSDHIDGIKNVALLPLTKAQSMSVIRQLKNEVDILLQDTDSKGDILYSGIMTYFEEKNNAKESFVDVIADTVTFDANVARVTNDILVGGNADIKGNVTAKNFIALNSDDAMKLMVTNDKVMFCSNTGSCLSFFKYENNSMYLYIWDPTINDYKVCDLSGSGWKAVETIVVNTVNIHDLKSGGAVNPNNTLTYNQRLYSKGNKYYTDSNCTTLYTGDCIVKAEDVTMPVYDKQGYTGESPLCAMVRCIRYTIYDIINGELGDGNINYIYSTKMFRMSSNKTFSYSQTLYWCDVTTVSSKLKVQSTTSNPSTVLYEIPAGKLVLTLKSPYNYESFDSNSLNWTGVVNIELLNDLAQDERYN